MNGALLVILVFGVPFLGSAILGYVMLKKLRAKNNKRSLLLAIVTSVVSYVIIVTIILAIIVSQMEFSRGG